MICGFLDGEGGIVKGGRYAEGSRFRGGWGGVERVDW